MKSFLLNGSPRYKKGTHTALLDALEKGLKEAGSEVIKKNVYQLDIKPCLGCNSCWTHTPGSCIQKDDMESILPLVAEADLLVLATPVYVDGMTGPTKTFLDRLLPLLMGSVELREGHMRHVVRKNVKRGSVMLVSASGITELDNFDPLVTHVKAVSKNLGRDYVGEILAPSGLYIRDHKEEWEKVVRMVASAGSDLVKKGMFSEDISYEISNLVSRQDVIKYLNDIFRKYE